MSAVVIISVIYWVNSAPLNTSSRSVFSTSSDLLILSSLHSHKMTCILSLRQHTHTFLPVICEARTAPVIHTLRPRFTGKTHGMNITLFVEIILIELSWCDGKAICDTFIICRHAHIEIYCTFTNTGLCFYVYFLCSFRFRISIWLKEL